MGTYDVIINENNRHEHAKTMNDKIDDIF